MPDITSFLLAAMWACLAATVVAYALRPALAGRRAAVSLVAVSVAAFAAGYLAHRVPAHRGAAFPAVPAFATADLGRIPFDSTPALGAIDRVEMRLPRFVDIAGWTADGLRYGPGSGVFLLVDGKDRVRGEPASYGGDRPDVARVFDDDDLLWVGYRIRYVPDGLPPGPHRLQIVLASSDLKHAYVMTKPVPFAVR